MFVMVSLLEWVIKFVSVLCLEASCASMFVCLFHVLAYISWWLRQKGFLVSRACKKRQKILKRWIDEGGFYPGYIHTTPDRYNPGHNSWDTNLIARQIEASSLPPSPSVQC